MNSIFQISQSIKSHDTDNICMKGQQKCESLQSKLQLVYGVKYSLHHFYFLNFIIYFDQLFQKFIESHDMEKIHVTGRLEIVKHSIPTHRNCFFQYHHTNTGRTFSFKIIFYFFTLYHLKKILEGKSFETNPSSLNYTQLGVDYE